MLDGIKTSFSISDLAQLSGVSAHSIRIWERRYQLFEPHRTEGNIRRYSNEDLKKILNVALLLNSGFKISDLASMSMQELSISVNSLRSKSDDHQKALDELKVAMMNFDSRSFEDTYGRLISRMPFYNLYIEVMVPFLQEIGNLWQTNNITVAHEHYISNRLRQKLFFQIENLPANYHKQDSQFILFLPLNELHELGLMFLHYVLRLHGFDSIYLGPQVDIDSLQGIPVKPNRIFITYLTFAPPEEELTDFFKDMRSHVLYKEDQFWAVGQRVRNYRKHASWTQIHVFSTVAELIEKIKVTIHPKYLV